jgi:hypothetical protein
MANPWFRLYEEFATDPKVQTLPHVYQRHLLMIFCAKCRGILGKADEEELADYMRVGVGELATIKELFLRKHFIEDDWSLINWNKRQFLSDSSTDRVRSFRARRNSSSLKQDETLHETRAKQTVTPPDTDTDTDTEQKRENKADLLPVWVDREAWDGFVEMRKRKGWVITDRARNGLLKDLEKLRAQGQDPNACLDKATMNCWRGVYEIRNGGGNGNGNGNHRTKADATIDAAKSFISDLAHQSVDLPFGGETGPVVEGNVRPLHGQTQRVPRG